MKIVIVAAIVLLIVGAIESCGGGSSSILYQNLMEVIISMDFVLLVTAKYMRDVFNDKKLV